MSWCIDEVLGCRHNGQGFVVIECSKSIFLSLSQANIYSKKIESKTRIEFYPLYSCPFHLKKSQDLFLLKHKVWENIISFRYALAFSCWFQVIRSFKNKKTSGFFYRFDKLGASVYLASLKTWILWKLVFPFSVCEYCMLPMCCLLTLPVSTPFLGSWLLFWSCSFFSLCWSYNYVWVRVPCLSSSSIRLFIQISTCLTWEYTKRNKSSIQKWRSKSKIGNPWKKSINEPEVTCLALHWRRTSAFLIWNTGIPVRNSF